MALTSTNRGSGARNTGGESTYDISPASTIAAGSFAVLCLSVDNAAAGGTNPISSVTDSVGNTWEAINGRTRTSGAANDGVSTQMYTSTLATQITTSDTITVNFSTTTVARSYTLTEVGSDNGGTVKIVRRSTASGAGASTSPSGTTTEMVYTGDMLFSVMGAEHGNGTITPDSDTTNGEWSTAQTANVGTTTSGIEICTQNKIVTAIGDQTYNCTITSADWAVVSMILTDTTKIIPQFLTNGGSDTDDSSYETGSISPSANKTIIAMIWAYDAGAALNAAASMTCTGNGLTWTFADGGGTTTNRLAVFRASSGSTPTPGTVTFGSVTSSGTADGAVWLIFEIDNVDISTNDGVVQALSVSTTNDTAEVTLAAFSSVNNGTVGVWGAYDNAGGILTFTEGTGFANKTAQSQAAGGDTIANFYEYRQDNDTSVDVSVSAANDRLVGVAMEIKSNISTGTSVKDIIGGYIPAAR